jgi:hypothetical protein
LNTIAYLDARQVVRARRFGNIRKIKIENDFGAIDCQWSHQVVSSTPS